MKEEDKNIENLIDKMMAENTLEAPSIDFTSKIMAQVLTVQESKVMSYKPLISKTSWIFISLGAIALIFYSSLFSGTEYNPGTDNSYTEKFSALFSGIHLSKGIISAFMVVPFIILIQIGVLKNYFDKRYEM